jgi:hypothetical protein
VFACLFSFSLQDFRFKPIRQETEDQETTFQQPKALTTTTSKTVKHNQSTDPGRPNPQTPTPELLPIYPSLKLQSRNSYQSTHPTELRQHTTTMPTIVVPLSSTFTPQITIPPSDFINIHRIMHVHSENVLSGLVLIALLTYFYTAFSKIFQPGGDQQINDKRASCKLESRIYYSSPAAV